MGTVGTLLSGLTLFLNGLMSLGKANAKSVAYFNLFVGIIQVVTPFYLVITSDQSNWALYNNGVIFLFGLTFLYVAVTNLKELEGDGLGWFSLWVAIITMIYGIVTLVQFHDTLGMITWMIWSFLWLLFYISLTLKKNIDRYIGRVAIVVSWLTLTAPAMFTLTGISDSPFVKTLLMGGTILAIIYFIVSGWSLKKASIVIPVNN